MTTGNVVLKDIDPSNVKKIGSGRPVSPIRMRMLGELTPNMYTVGASEQLFQGVGNFTILNKNDLVRLRIRYKYFDWRKKYNKEQPSDINNQVPYLYALVYAIGPNMTRAGSFGLFGYKDIEGTDYQADNNVNLEGSFPFITDLGNQNPRTTSIAVESTNEIQTFEYEFKYPFSKASRFACSQ